MTVFLFFQDIFAFLNWASSSTREGVYYLPLPLCWRVTRASTHSPLGPFLHTHTHTHSSAQLIAAALTNTVVSETGSRWDPWPYFRTFHNFTCFDIEPPLRRTGVSLLLVTPSLLGSDWLLDCYWTSPAQWFLVPNATGLINMFYQLKTLVAFRPHRGKSQSHCTTGELPPIALSWRQVSWDSQPRTFFFATDPLRS
jgi:hypothetical protein